MPPLFLTLSFLAIPAPAAAPAAVVWKPGFGRAALWNDGAAEVSVYEATDVRYGIPRSSRAVLIVVAEDLDTTALVKADDPASAPRTLRVLKLNHVRSIPTGVYVYQQMLSVFAGADRLDPVKLTMTSHEWCGNSFAEWRRDREKLELRTYFQKPGDVDVALAADDAVFYDAIPLLLRSLDFERTRGGALRVIESVFSSRPTPPKTEEARLELSRPAPKLYRVVLRRGDRRDTLDFEAAFPHGLLRWERSDGGSLRRTFSKRMRYWEENSPGDERLLPPAATR